MTTFNITINAVRTGAQGNLAQVIKQVDFTVTGELSGQKFALPQTVDLSEADPASFTPFANTTEAMVTSWVEAAFAERMPAVQSHIQFVLEREAAKASLAADALPWAPPAPVAPIAPEPAAAPAPATT